MVEVRQALGNDPGNQVIGQRSQRQIVAARADGGQQLPWPMGDQEEGRVGRWFFERLEQGVGGRRIAVVNAVEDGDAVPCPSPRVMQGLTQIAHVFDADHRVIALAFLGAAAQHGQIGV
ncbi:hypothetical protein D9M69_702540 [compost metagenome]